MDLVEERSDKAVKEQRELNTVKGEKWVEIKQKY
jgi:hypothetical protein